MLLAGTQSALLLSGVTTAHHGKATHETYVHDQQQRRHSASEQNVYQAVTCYVTEALVFAEVALYDEPSQISSLWWLACVLALAARQLTGTGSHLRNANCSLNTLLSVAMCQLDRQTMWQ